MVFEPATEAKCIYLPNFYDAEHNEVPYYTEDLWREWQLNDAAYVSEAKTYLIELSNELNHTLTMSQLTDPQQNFTWNAFEAAYWKSNQSTDGIFYRLSRDSYHAESSLLNAALFPNRRCWNEDYSSLYREDIAMNLPPPFCNVADYGEKARTWTYPTETLRSLFPMQTRTRVNALRMSNTAYFVSIIIVQWADLMICKTRIRSLFEQGMTNTFMNYALIFETILGAFLVYVPIANTVAGTAPMRFTWWTAAIPFCFLIYIYDEVRKGWIRKNQKGFIHRNTFW